MAKERPSDIQEAPDLGDDENQEETHDSKVRDEENETNGDVTEENPSQSPSRSGRRRYKWMIFSMVGILLIGSGYAVLDRFGRDIFDKWNHRSKPLKITDKDHLQENILSPFFIPLPPDSSNRMLVIDFSVIWDGLASVRFEKKKLLIRNKLYGHISKLAQKKKNLKERNNYLEREMSRIFRKSLGREDLAVRIKAIRVY
ncbi:MAG: hypothetical protein JRJ85_24930 [Deltaproteobacteria bacterium]|nr:hypothetical protein [Deltaproteobacteria bacterium]